MTASTSKSKSNTGVGPLPASALQRKVAVFDFDQTLSTHHVFKCL